MNEDYSEDRPDFSGMWDEELSEIVNSRFGQYRQEVVDGARDELRRRAERLNDWPKSPEQDEAPAAGGGGPVAEGGVRPPAPPATVPGASVYSPGQITLAAFLGSPIAGCLLLAQNYQALGDGGRMWQPLVVGIAVTTLLVAAGFLLPEKCGGGGGVWLSVGMYFYAKQSQGDAFENYLKAGGRKGTWPVAVLTGIVCGVVLLALFIALAMMFGVADEPGAS